MTPTGTENDRIRDVSELLALGRKRRACKNVRFTARTRGKSPACLFQQEQVRIAILQCVITEKAKY